MCVYKPSSVTTFSTDTDITVETYNFISPGNIIVSTLDASPGAVSFIAEYVLFTSENAIVKPVLYVSILTGCFVAIMYVLILEYKCEVINLETKIVCRS